MSVSTDALLVYGYSLGEPDDPAGGVEFTGDLRRRLTEISIGEDKSLDGLGLTIERYCSAEYPMFVLAAHSMRAYRGWVVDVDMAALEDQRTSQFWDINLLDGAELLGLQPEKGPHWMLVSYTDY